MATYSPIVVLLGQAKIAAAIAGGPSITIKNLAVGDGNGVTTVPLETMTGLVNEVGRVLVDSAARDMVDNTKVIVTATLPIDMGPFTIREVALFTDDGQLFAIGGYPETFKATASQGATVVVTIEFVIQVASTANVEITLNIANLTAIDQLLRVPFIGVDSFTNDPPSSPAAGDLVVVGLSPTGAFVGKSNRLAQFNGTLWVTAIAPERTVVGDKTTGMYYRFTATTWVNFLASETDQGLVTYATLAQHKTGALDTVATNPAGVAGAVQTGQWIYAVDSGTANAMVVALTPVPTALTPGMTVHVKKIGSPNTGAATLDIGVGGATAIKSASGAALLAGDLSANTVVELVFDGTNWQVVNFNQYAIDTAVVKTLGTDFVDINAFSEWLGRYRITPNGSVTLSCPAGTTAFSSAQLFQHPDQERVSIVGVTVSAPPAAGSFTITGSSTGAQASDTATNYAALAAAWTTKFTFAGSNGLKINGGIGALTNILITGPGYNSGSGFGLTLGDGFYSNVSNVAVAKFGGAGILIDRSEVDATNLYSFNCGTHGIEIDGGWLNYFGALVSLSNRASGMYAGFGTNVATASASSANLSGNYQYGLLANRANGSLYYASVGPVMNYNGTGGANITAGKWDLSLPNIINCGTAINLAASSYADAGGGQLATGNTYSVWAAGGCGANVTGSTLTTCSPAVNTNGNSNSYITD
jgi:ethanolamine utilization microcompartment shell protein EutS